MDGRPMIERIETARLVLRKARESVLEAIWRSVWRDERLAATMLWTPTPDLEGARARLARTIAYQAENYGYFVCLRETDEPIGFGGVRETEPGLFEETGICIAAACQRRGYGKELLAALVDLAFRRLGGKRFIYACFHDNEASAALCRSCGFTYAFSRPGVRQRDGYEYICDYFALDHAPEPGNA